MTPERIAVARGLIAGVMLELLAPETVEQAENMHHIGSTDTSSETGDDHGTR